MTRTIRVTSSGSIKRPLEEVAAANVHRGVRFTIVSEDAQHCRYRQEVALLGMRQADDLLNTWQPDGSLTSEAVAGTNKDLRVL